ncbi:hypothetical protein VCRA2116O29_210061 [Vibrio crassostreae]|nr:hypothetical protein VCRA2119O48_100022 [Vibrio crassostreae]CAK2436487.1 hypothetical protein VCRA2116O29_210061 [Vibrio crassostreae]CAK3180341.1 hypothetical protein VCRA2123E76_110032 [Vibrio crassostreae]CAK3834008.1 hypothetical protein VCRA212O16_200069 [Vibrio crassostreae]CAK3890925.1 hypothetical protein VCRA2123O74_60022 [Vibrio crassostreae]
MSNYMLERLGLKAFVDHYRYKYGADDEINQTGYSHSMGVFTFISFILFTTRPSGTCQLLPARHRCF